MSKSEKIWVDKNVKGTSAWVQPEINWCRHNSVPAKSPRTQLILQLQICSLHHQSNSDLVKRPKQKQTCRQHGVLPQRNILIMNKFSRLWYRRVLQWVDAVFLTSLSSGVVLLRVHSWLLAIFTGDTDRDKLSVRQRYSSFWSCTVKWS